MLLILLSCVTQHHFEFLLLRCSF